MSFVFINRRGNCRLVRPGDDEGSKAPARQCRRHVECGPDDRKARTVTASGDATFTTGNTATQLPATRSDGETLGNATTLAVGDGRGVIGLSSGVSFSSPKWQRSSW